MFKLLCFTFVLFITITYSARYLFWRNVRISKALKLADVDSCPICYGYTGCDQLETDILIDGFTWPNNMVNTKNAYIAKTRSGIRLLLKQLTSYWEFRDLDINLCKTFNLKSDCKPYQAVNEKLLLEKINNIVAPNLTRLSTATKPFKGLMMCPYSKSIFKIVEPYVLKESPQYEYDLMSVWTILTLNPEPIMLQLMPKAEGWPVPTYGGVCGRLAIVTYEGDPISTLTDLNWLRKLKFAKGILTAALDFTYKHDQYRFYLMDWSIENIVADEYDVITFVDLEDFVVVDKTTHPEGNDPHYWYKRTERAPDGSLANICQHHLSDHNIYEACKVLGGGNEPLLYPIPDNINAKSKQLRKLLVSCLRPVDDRFRTVVKLQHVINNILAENATINFDSLLFD